MNPLNKTGQKLFELKKELMKSYPDIVKDSMALVLAGMLREGDIEETAHNIALNNQKSETLLHHYLLSHSEYRKTPKEIKEELGGVLKELKESLTGTNLLDVEFSIDTETLTLLIIKTFHIHEDFIMEYFGVTEKEMPKLMKKGGLVESFVSLRLSKIVSDIVDAFPKRDLGRSYTLPYRNKEGDGFSIELILDLSPEKYEKNKDMLTGCIQDILDHSVGMFEKKLEI